ncbi:hypothetical protein QTI24_11335 [Variovorax sp. J22P240]|uniref:hypothetical protein n=1 Tax=Variovorax sp. J22P240 TaxID=3053514 RepID=UPI0025788302|nr:hypothetical protein [Variovorax sp. J22P240]MDL9999198.1 hypothetical protein [Variovorax sp. J22P240]
MSAAAPAARLPNVDDEWPATQRMAYQADAAAERFNPLVPPLAAGEGIAMRRPRNGSAHPVMGPSSSAIPSRTIRRSASRSSRSPRPADKRASVARRLGAWSVLIAVVLLVAVGWGYVYNSRNSAVPAVAKEFATPVPIEPVVPAPVDTAASPPVVQVAEPVQLAPTFPPVAETPPAETVKPVVAAAPKARKRTPGVAVAAPPPEAPAPEPAPPPAPQPVALATPQSHCAGLNFFARAQCMAAQCAKADYRVHAQCEAVRRQQQIDEERRNPTLLN